MKTYIKILTIMSALFLAATAQAQVLIGGFQGAGDPTDAGWINEQTANPIISDPSCSFVAAGVPGFAQSLQISAAVAGGFGYPTLQLGLSPSQIASFNTNSYITFTFSVPAGTYTGGYAQIYNLALNAPGYGYNNQSWANAQEMGNTNNTTPGTDPNYYFAAGANGLMTMTVSLNYSSVRAAIIAGGESSLQLTFQGNQGGGAPTNFLFNSVVLSTTPFGQVLPGNNIIVDQFNPTNNPYAGTNIYAAGQITNVYGPWFGDVPTISWDPTMDAQTNANSGSLKLVNVFTGGDQWTFTDGTIGAGTGPGITPPITNNFSLLTFEFDVMYAPGSPTWTNGGVVSYGNLEWGIVGGPVGAFSGTGYGAVQVNVTNVGWTHVVIPLNPQTDADFASISDIFFKQDGGAYGNLIGTSTLWLDNLKFTYTNVAPVIPPPVMTIQKPVPALRLFTGGSDQNGRTELISATGMPESWVGATAGSPVTYSFKIISVPSNMAQSGLFLVPQNGVPSTTYNGQDYTATNGLWLTFGSSGIARVSWKTNDAGANAYSQNVALQFTNAAGAVGTWTLTFTSATAGTVTGPGGSPLAFTIADPNAAADFADVVSAYFGCQISSTAAIGAYEDWASISITGTGSPINENFTTEPSGTLSATWRTVYGGADGGAAVIISTNDFPEYWVNWTVPAVGLSLGSSTNLPASQWINPGYYSDYNDAITAPRGIPSTFGSKAWVLLPNDDLPTVDGNIGSAVAPKAFFLLSTNVISP